MLILSQVIQFTTDGGPRIYHGRSNAYGLTIGSKHRPLRSNEHWSWPGPAPHPTRMHHYASLSAPQKAAWQAVAAAMANEHSLHGVATYNGPIAYMQTNLLRRLRGQPYSDTAPAIGPAVPTVSASLSTLGPRFNPVDAAHVP